RRSRAATASSEPLNPIDAGSGVAPAGSSRLPQKIGQSGHSSRPSPSEPSQHSRSTAMHKALDRQRSSRSSAGLLEDSLTADELRKIDCSWRAANYLSVGQIYRRDNPLLREPLKLEHTKPRLLGHWGTTPGLNFIYVHMNRLIKKNDLNAIF